MTQLLNILCCLTLGKPHNLSELCNCTICRMQNRASHMLITEGNLYDKPQNIYMYKVLHLYSWTESWHKSSNLHDIPHQHCFLLSPKPTPLLMSVGIQHRDESGNRRGKEDETSASLRSLSNTHRYCLTTESPRANY